MRPLYYRYFGKNEGKERVFLGKGGTSLTNKDVQSWIGNEKRQVYRTHLRGAY